MSTSQTHIVNPEISIGTIVNGWIEAFLAFNQAALNTKHPDQKVDAVREGLATYLRANAGQQGWTDVEANLDNAYAILQAQADSETYAVIKRLVKAIRIKLKAELHTEKTEEAWVELKALESKLTPAIPDTVRAYIWHVKISLELRQAHEQALKSTDHGLSLNLKKGSPLWYMLQTDRVLCLHELRRFREARAAINQLQGFRELDHLVKWSAPLLEALLCSTVGPMDRGLAVIKEIRDRGLKVNPRTLLSLRLWMLVYSGNLTAASAAISSDEMSLFPEQSRQMYLASIGLARADTEVAIRHARIALDLDDGDVVCEGNCILILAMSHLVDKDPIKARKKLERLELHPSHINPILAWMRLELMEGNEDAAVKHLVDILRDLGPEGVRIRLKWAHELSASQLARVWTRAESELRNDPENQGNWIDSAQLMVPANKAATQSNADPEPVNATASTMPASHGKNAIARRQRLKQLFIQYSQLTRLQVSELLECAPATAAKDLAELERRGDIRRVDTSAHARTSYYERVDG